MLDIVVVLAVLSSLLVVVALSQPLAGRLRLSPVVLLAVIGAAIGAASGVLLNSQLSPRVGEAVTLFANLPLGSGSTPGGRRVNAPRRRSAPRDR